MWKLKSHVIVQAVSEIVDAPVSLSLNVAGHVIKVQTIELSHISDYSFVEDIATEGTTIRVLLRMSLACVCNY